MVLVAPRAEPSYQRNPKNTMDTSRSAVEELIWERIALIPDPEIPVISIVELGVVRDVQWDGKKLKITITPTYTGCPNIIITSGLTNTSGLLVSWWDWLCCSKYTNYCLRWWWW